MRLDGKMVALTGGSGGLGSVLAARLTAEGASVTVVDRVPPADGLRFIAAELSTADGIDAAGRRLAALAPDILINLAGVQFFGAIETQPDASILLTYMVNLVAPVLLCRAVVPGMRAKGAGLVVNIGSTFASIPFAHFATYSSSKAGLKGFSEALRREVAPAGLRVTYVAPRAIRTAMNGRDVMRLAEATGMAMDPPERVAQAILDAIRDERREVYIGFPESLFARVNALTPRLVDRALTRSDRIARDILLSAQS